MLRDQWFFGRKAKVFTLQWHLTNTCPFHCRHCYDRSARSELSWIDAQRVLADLAEFARARRVEPRVCLSGGDPLCYPHFWQLYEAVARAGMAVSILGNPTDAETIRRLLTFQPPLYYQVSLEGMREHNDAMRGAGHYERTLVFLRAARDLGLRTSVMLTLTRANLDQVLPLASELQLLTCRMTFNRLAQVGEATTLETPARGDLAAFMGRYLAARRSCSVLGVKDNLLSIVRHQYGRPSLPGCTGAGCGAAFNFVALLPDGEVHACRKFPSPIGDLRESSLGEVYDSPRAQCYRQGSSACRGCKLRKNCGGCLAVSHGRGLDPLRERDPDCFLTA
ncbi:MAG: selenobiotic family peptide radical SAM maturase [Verrucomicrobia bacterium]|nr:selenobiotic family peptide radical SAM maturase [Verrucomicrobiota bacterium]